jgi:hypothetical protein
LNNFISNSNVDKSNGLFLWTISFDLIY